MSLSNEEYLVQLAALLSARQGSTFLTTKRFSYEPPAPALVEDDTPMSEEAESSSSSKEWPLLYRATDGNSDKKSKVKISTIVQPNDLDSFLASYSAILRASITYLRPKRKKTSKQQATSSSKKGGAAAASSQPTTSGGAAAPGTFARLPKLVGPKRGKGAHKRQSLRRRRDKLVKKLVERRKRERQ